MGKPARFFRKLSKYVRPAASFFGLGEDWDRLVDKASKAAGDKPITSATINGLIDDLVNEARAKGLKNIDDLQSKLNALHLDNIMSNTVKEIVVKEGKNIKDKLARAQANFDAAEELVTTARSAAGRADFAEGAERYDSNSTAGEAKHDATKIAKQAQNMYDKVEGGI